MAHTFESGNTINRRSNYDIMRDRMQNVFADHDLNAIAGEWDLKAESSCMTLIFVGRAYSISCDTGEITYTNERRDTCVADYNVAMTLFDILTRPRTAASAQYAPFDHFASVQLSHGSSSDMFQKYKEYFDKNGEKLSASCKTLGGEPRGRSDIGYLIPVFRDLKVWIQFWHSDDEFPADLRILCDTNILRFMHYETMMFMIFHILDRIYEASAADPK